jgi:hypothetical protein
MGRLLQSNPAEHAARSFSCGEYAVIIGADWYPYDTSEDVGQENELGELDSQEGLSEDPGNCSGDYVGDSNDNYYDWQSNNTSIATISGGGPAVDFEGVSSGSTTIYGSVADEYGCSANIGQPVTISGDQTPIVTGIAPDIWDSAASAPTTTQVTFSGQNFGTNAPTLSFSPGSGISYTLSSYNDTQIVANVTVAAGTPTEDVNVSVTNNGYGGNNFGSTGGQPAQGAPATATVQAEPAGPSLVVAYSAYIPVDHVSGPSGCLYGLVPVQYIYKGDGGYGTYRATETAEFNAATLNVADFFPMTGLTKQYGYGSPANGASLSARDEDNVPHDCYLWNWTAQAPYSNFSYTPLNEGTNLGALQLSGSASNPLETTLAAISWNMITTINVSNPSQPTASVQYNHTCYPAHQVKVGPDNTVVYSYTPPYNNLAYIAACLTSGVNLLTEVTGTTSFVSIPTQ